MKPAGLRWLLVLCVSHAVAWTHISEDRLRTALDENEYTLVAFTHPGSDACTALETEWISLQKTSKDPNIISFDCGKDLGSCRDLDVASYPAIRLYRRDGSIIRYRGDRKAPRIHTFLNRSLRPTVREVGVNQVTPLLGDDDVVFIAHLPAGDVLRDRFRALATKYHDQYSFILSGPLKGLSIFQCVNNIDEEEHTLTDFSTVNSLEAFVKLCSAPLIPELTRRNEAEYMQKGKSLLHYFFSSEAEKDKYRSEMRPLAKKYAEYLYFTLTDVNEYPEMLKLLGQKPGSKTGLSLQNPNTGDVFPFRGKKKITPQVVEQFLDDVIEGKIPSVSTGPGKGHDEL
ncbi:thioredoxin-like fold protein [Echria macrotheca]|uniref:Thioredoxin-like fold protein n=1 Tax=Echria macrotheca TaxID=438768 RepID=A0AAJ0B653_9PEZI|nr:thioredoxin-like fold protein [Echria macrotheca]